MDNFSIESYQQLLQPITDFIATAPLNKNLQDQLNTHFPANGEVFNELVTASHAGIAAGILCKHEAPGIKFGRVIKSCAALQGFSVDVVQMDSIIGPHHRHPAGEIDLIMPIGPEAKFDDHSAGWLVYEPDSAHCPTVTEGEALVLYLLPNGDIEFTGK